MEGKFNAPAEKLNRNIKQLRDNLVPKSFRSTLRHTPQGEVPDASNAYDPRVRLSLERARLYTESYKATEGQPIIIRRAKALANVLEKMTIYITKGEVIVGNYAPHPNELTWHPEYSWRWLSKEIYRGYSNLLDGEGKEELKRISEYWKVTSVQGSERNYLSPELKKVWRYNGASLFTHQTESGVPDYEHIFQVGLDGLLKEAKDKLAGLDSDESIPATDLVEAKEFLDAVIISLESVIKWSGRYAELAREQAEADGEWKNQLLEIVETCQWVPANSPRSLREAIQTFWFLHLLTHLIEAYENGITVRVDQVFYPFYRKDIDEGRLNRQKAKELFEYLWIKCQDLSFLFAPVAGGGAAQGSALQQTFTLGGMTPDGDDAVNELTYVILDSRDEVRLAEPTTAIRIWNGTPRQFLLRVTDSIRRRSGTCSLFNDEVVISRLLKCGIPLRDARNYGIEQCMRWTIPGKNIVYRSIDGRIVLPKCLELALNQGVDKFTREQLGAPTPDPLTFTNVSDVLDAFFAQVRYFASRLGVIVNVVDVLYEKHLPRPLLSSLLELGIAAGKDCRRWYYFPRRQMGVVGPTTVANSIAAIKKLVFDNKRVTMKELIEALSSNWEGKEELRQLCLNAPKFGNDDDYVDLIAREIHIGCAKEIERVENYYGAKFMLDASSVASYYWYSTLTGATPDGRKDADLFADGTISPAAGTDIKGPTAVLLSAAKCDPVQSYNHLLNQRFMPQLLEGRNKELFATYLKTWHDMGIHHIQFNIVDNETLWDAQRHPEKYRTLVIRVAGYAAYFVELSFGLQEEIIRRNLHQAY